MVAGSGPTNKPMPAADLPKGGKTVKMIFPKPVRLQAASHQHIMFPAGVNDVPVEYADHWYLKANGATFVEVPELEEELEEEEEEESSDDSKSEEESSEGAQPARKKKRKKRS